MAIVYSLIRRQKTGQRYLNGFLRGVARPSHTFYVWLCIALVAVAVLFEAKRWNQHEVFIYDMGGYYLYLPAIFITHDVGQGSFLTGTRARYVTDGQETYGQERLPNGRMVFRYPIGMAFLHAPWFAATHAWEIAHGKVADGFGKSYEKMIAIGCLVYGLLGLWLLGIELRHYFPDHLAGLTLLAVGLGTNLLYYITYEGAMSHGNLFLLNTLLVRFTRKWYSGARIRHAVALGLTMGLIIIVRPSDALMALVPILWGLGAVTLQERWHWLWKQRNQVLLAVALAFLFVSAQMIFWKVAGGSWYIDTYGNERFYFTEPEIIKGLFSARRGWLVYTPLMTFGLLGILWVRRYVAALWVPVLVITPIAIYIIYSWWDWVYGGSYSSRPVISLYPMLALCMTSVWQRWQHRLIPLAAIVALLVGLNLIQTWQYRQGLLYGAENDWNGYKHNFLRLSWE